MVSDRNFKLEPMTFIVFFDNVSQFIQEVNPCGRKEGTKPERDYLA